MSRFFGISRKIGWAKLHGTFVKTAHQSIYYYVAGKRRQECSQVHRKSSHMVLLLFYALLVESMKHHTVLVPSARCLQDPQITVLQCFP